MQLRLGHSARLLHFKKSPRYQKQEEMNQWKLKEIRKAQVNVQISTV
jgi:hypothetical protein